MKIEIEGWVILEKKSLWTNEIFPAERLAQLCLADIYKCFSRTIPERLTIQKAKATFEIEVKND